MICGVLPPSICGVGDYTKNILNTSLCADWEIFSNQNWSLFNIFSLLFRINKMRADIVFLQYPAEGYGWSLSPHIILLFLKFIKNKKVYTVLHEYTSFNPKGKFFIDKIFSKSTGLIFTTHFEANSFIKNNPRYNGSVSIIPILSNIPPPKSILSIADRDIDIAYFGHIRPNKGLEEFMRVMEEIKLHSNKVNFKILGQVPRGYESFALNLEKIYPDFTNICWLNLQDFEVADILNRTKICFLPFPDGVSERRGSFLAAIQSGCVVASYSGPWVTNHLKNAFIELSYFNESKKLIDLLNSSGDLNEFHVRSLNYQLKSNIRTWDDLAYEYIKISS